MSLVGARVVRKEDPNLITGKGSFVDDIKLTDCAHMMFVGSPVPHGVIRSIDLKAALAIDGVLGIWTAEDFVEYPDLPQGQENFERPVLARDKVRWLGEPIAVVVAEDRYIAADAAEAVTIEIDELPAVLDVLKAAESDSPLLFEIHGSNVVKQVAMIDDLEREISAADNRVQLQLHNQRCAPLPIETMAVLADWSPDGLTLWASFQAPHHLRNYLSAWLAISQQSCRIITPDVGGGFGNKISWYPELFIAPLLSRWSGRPVKFTQTRSEAMLQMNHGRDQKHVLDVGFNNDGKILALRMVITANAGAYPDPVSMGMPVMTGWMASGCYEIPHVATSHRIVVTNTTPLAAYRGAGRPEAAYSVERIVDLVARRTEIDPVEIRKKNFIQSTDFPYQVPHETSVVYDSGDFAALMDECLTLFDYEGLKEERERRKKNSKSPLLGIGFSSWLEIAGYGPSGSLEGFGHLGSWESAQVRINPDGSAVVFTGTAPHGQGHQTVLSQIASDALGIPYEDIRVIYGDTATVIQGIGTMGSRSISTAGAGVHSACLMVVERAKRIAAHLLEANPVDVEVREGAFNVRGTPGRQVSWSDVGYTSYQPLRLPEELTPGALEERIYQEVPNYSFPSGCYACVVEIDRETGNINILNYVVVDDCGTVINPLLAEGQVHGGVAQGIAQALYESITYDESGTLATGNLTSYLAPSAPDLPAFTASRITTICPNHIFGAKGIGESGAVGAPPAVVNAVVDALADFGVEHLDMPLSPEKVWNALNKRGEK